MTILGSMLEQVEKNIQTRDYRTEPAALARIGYKIFLCRHCSLHPTVTIGAPIYSAGQCTENEYLALNCRESNFFRTCKVEKHQECMCVFIYFSPDLMNISMDLKQVI